MSASVPAVLRVVEGGALHAGAFRVLLPNGRRGVAWLAKYTGPSADVSVPVTCGARRAARDQSPDEAIAQYLASSPPSPRLALPALHALTKNTVKRCSCGKSVAHTMPTCNGCGASLVRAIDHPTVHCGALCACACACVVTTLQSLACNT